VRKNQYGSWIIVHRCNGMRLTSGRLGYHWTHTDEPEVFSRVHAENLALNWGGKAVSIADALRKSR